MMFVPASWWPRPGSPPPVANPTADDPKLGQRIVVTEYHGSGPLDPGAVGTIAYAHREGAHLCVLIAPDQSSDLYVLMPELGDHWEAA